MHFKSTCGGVGFHPNTYQDKKFLEKGKNSLGVDASTLFSKINFASSIFFPFTRSWFYSSNGAFIISTWSIVQSQTQGYHKHGAKMLYLGLETHELTKKVYQELPKKPNLGYKYQYDNFDLLRLQLLRAR